MIQLWLECAVVRWRLVVRIRVASPRCCVARRTDFELERRPQDLARQAGAHGREAPQGVVTIPLWPAPVERRLGREHAAGVGRDALRNQ
eukprot:3920406-Prymnesium_polylepis.1